jgi:3-methyladenine DNA glycosylase AlkD
MKLNAREVVRRLNKVKTKERAEAAVWYFKTGEGQYGRGDVFVGVTVPEQRKIARDFGELSFVELDKLLKNKVHECRLTALFILVGKYKGADKKTRDKIARFYLSHRRCVNNWDLVDSSASYILGENLVDKNKSVLYKLARSKNIWDRRIAIIATHSFIRHNDLDDAFAIATLLMKDKHDLIHKAVGWTLRETGKRSLKKLEKFLKLNAGQMPRTMLRYSTEKFSHAKRNFYLKSKTQSRPF